MNQSRPFDIPKRLVWEAFKQVKANGGAAGVDQESIELFERNLKRNLYRIWNRMSSGSYFPPPVKAVPIPKKSGGTRVLGVPTIADRVAQTVVKTVLEPKLEVLFHEDSYGYRPGRSAHDAIAITRKRCWKLPWVFEFDIKALFDNIDHALLMKALRKHCQSKWIQLYVERWLKAPMLSDDGTLIKRDRGTPQGGVVSPLLANLFLHYAFDVWLGRKFPQLQFCRYADDGLVHCRSFSEARCVQVSLMNRLKECGLEMHSEKSRIVYCKKSDRRANYQTVSFTFLGFTFKPRKARNSDGEDYVNFSPGVSSQALRAMTAKLRRWKVQLKTSWDIERIARAMNPILRGWHQYYGKFYATALLPLWRLVNDYLRRWVMRKYKRFSRHKVRAMAYLATIYRSRPTLFHHWKLGSGAVPRAG